MMTSRRSIAEGLRLSNVDLTRGDAVLSAACNFALFISAIYILHRVCGCWLRIEYVTFGTAGERMN